MSHIPRRTLVHGAAWAVPAVAVGTAAPALAVSCPPPGDDTATAVAWTSTQVELDYSADPWVRHVQYVFTNNGPVAIPSGGSVKIDISYNLYSDGTSHTDVQVDGGDVTAEVAAAAPVNNNDEDNTVAYAYTITVTATQDIAVDSTFTLTVLAAFPIPNGPVSEKVTAGAPAASTDSNGCPMAATALEVTGSSDGTSYSTAT